MAASDRNEQALADWLAELPALAASLDAGPAARKVLLEDMAADEALIDEAPDAHPVLLARAHLAIGTIHLLRAQDGAGELVAEQGLDHLGAAADVARSLRASGPRLRLLSQAGALVAVGAAHARHTRRRTVTRRLPELAEEVAEAFAEQAKDARRGTATLAAAQALGEGAAVVDGRARDAVLQRAIELAIDAKRDLVNAAELAKAGVAHATIAELRQRLGANRK
jgi:hypothetical protein